MAARNNTTRKGPPPGAVVPKVALTVDEAAWSLGLSRSKLYQLVSEREIAFVKHRGNTLFLPADLEAFALKYRQPSGTEGSGLSESVSL